MWSPFRVILVWSPSSGLGTNFREALLRSIGKQSFQNLRSQAELGNEMKTIRQCLKNLFDVQQRISE